MNRPLDFATLRAVSRRRAARWHGPDSDPWTSADWSNATVGEVGELAEALEALLTMNRITAAAGKAANAVKKLRRDETNARNEGDPDPGELRRAVGDELADVVIYADRLAAELSIDLGEAVADKFNRTSDRYGFPERLDLNGDPATRRALLVRELAEHVVAELVDDGAAVEDVVSALVETGALDKLGEPLVDELRLVLDQFTGRPSVFAAWKRPSS